jgi:mRNA degradation ribonuclease J1/J2
LKGLTPSWKYAKIYASPITKKLVQNQFPHLVDYVIELELNEEHWIYLDEQKKEGINVTLVDASNHCPGAVMFLFKGAKIGTVLHTGDFRFSENFFKNPFLYPPEKMNSKKEAISVEVDTLYLDNTFATRSVDFPSQEEAYRTCSKIVRDHPNYRVFLFTYLLGKEEVLLSLSEEFKTLIVVDE